MLWPRVVPGIGLGSLPSAEHPQTQVEGDAAEGRHGLACVFQKLLVGMEEEDWFIGNEVPKNRGKLNLLYPISRAAITNWDDMEKVGCGFCWVGRAQGPPPMPGVACCRHLGRDVRTTSRALPASPGSGSLEMPLHSTQHTGFRTTDLDLNPVSITRDLHHFVPLIWLSGPQFPNL